MFHNANVFNFDDFPFINFFSFLNHVFGVVLKKSLPEPCHKDSLLFSSRFYIYICDPILSRFLYSVQVMDWSSLHIDSQHMQHHILKDCSFSVGFHLYLLRKSVVHLCAVYFWRFFLDPLIYFRTWHKYHNVWTTRCPEMSWNQVKVIFQLCCFENCFD